MFKELNDYGKSTVEVLTHEGKVTYIEDLTKKKIKI